MARSSIFPSSLFSLLPSLCAFDGRSGVAEVPETRLPMALPRLLKCQQGERPAKCFLEQSNYFPSLHRSPPLCSELLSPSGYCQEPSAGRRNVLKMSQPIATPLSGERAFWGLPSAACQAKRLSRERREECMNSGVMDAQTNNIICWRSSSPWEAGIKRHHDPWHKGEGGATNGASW